MKTVERMHALNRVNWRNRESLLTWGAWFMVAALFFAPINKPATNIAIALALVCTFLAPRFVQRFQQALQHPVALGLLAWWLFLLFSVAYAPQPSVALASWSGMVAFAYPLFVLSLIGDSEKWRTRAFKGFMLAMGVVITISYLRYFQLIPQRAGGEDINTPFHNVAFKDYIQQGIASLMACAVLTVALIVSKTRASRIWLLIGLCLCLFSTIFVIKSRTALVILPLLIIFLGFVMLMTHKKARLPVLFVVIATPFVLWTAFNLAEASGSRITEIREEIDQYNAAKAATSSGTRIELWRQSLIMIEKAPMLGHGYDQWPVQFLAQTRDIANYSEFIKRFPHQEYLLIAAEQGLIGLVVFIVLLLALAGYIYKLPFAYALIFGSFLLIYATAGMVNNILGDFMFRHIFLIFLGFIPYLNPPKN